MVQMFVYKDIMDTPITVMSKTIKLSLSLDAKGIHVNIREQGKLPFYKYDS